MNAKARWFSLLGSLGCVICGARPVELHHVAEGSGLRSDFAVVPLCAEHHRGASGLHGMGTKAFIRLHRLPGESEYGLLVLTNERLAKHLAMLRAA